MTSIRSGSVLLALAMISAAPVGGACRSGGGGGTDYLGDAGSDGGDDGDETRPDGGGDGSGTCAETDGDCSSRPCCDEEGDACIDFGDGTRCATRCAPTSCSYGEARGFCSFMMCTPWDGDAEASDCTAGDRGCATDYGATEDTYCASQASGDGTVCLEVCTEDPSGCESGFHCSAVREAEYGVCVSNM